MATKKVEEAGPLPSVIPLEPCESWAAAEALARDALAFILSDPAESGANRIKAAALVLGKTLPAGVAPGDQWSFEDWLNEAKEGGEMSRL